MSTVALMLPNVSESLSYSDISLYPPKMEIVDCLHIMGLWLSSLLIELIKYISTIIKVKRL